MSRADGAPTCGKPTRHGSPCDNRVGCSIHNPEREPAMSPSLRRAAILAEVARLVIQMAESQGLDTSRLEALLHE